MSLLIKGIAMPKKAYKDIHGTLWSNGRFTLTEPNNTISNYEVVEVPTPHGRLIDADDLQELYANTDDLDISDYYVNIIVVRQNIKDMPTIIEAEK